MQTTTRERVATLISRNASLTFIAKDTGLTITEIKQIDNNLNNANPRNNKQTTPQPLNGFGLEHPVPRQKKAKASRKA